jgi:UDP-N-acetyl-D-mannosaminuronate dehydrogenase
VRRLRQLGADVVAHDPHVEEFIVDGDPVKMVSLEEGCDGADLVVVLQRHRAVDLDEVAARATLVFDTRGRLRGDNVIRL